MEPVDLKRSVSFSSDHDISPLAKAIGNPQIRITPEPASRLSRIQVTHSSGPTPKTFTPLDEDASLHQVILQHQQSERYRHMTTTPQPIIDNIRSTVRRPSITMRQTSTHESMPPKIVMRRASESSEVFIGEAQITKTSDITRVFDQERPLTAPAGATNLSTTTPIPNIQQATSQIDNLQIVGIHRTQHSPLAGYHVQGGHPRLQRPPHLEHTPYTGMVIPDQLTIDYAKDVVGMDFAEYPAVPYGGGRPATASFHESKTNTQDNTAVGVLKNISRKLTEVYSQGTRSSRIRAIDELTRSLPPPSIAASSSRKPLPVSPVIVFEDPRRTEGCCGRAQKILIFTDEGDVESHYAF